MNSILETSLVPIKNVVLIMHLRHIIFSLGIDITNAQYAEASYALLLVSYALNNLGRKKSHRIRNPGSSNIAHK